MSNQLLTPKELNIPGFEHFRLQQLEAIESIEQAAKRFTGLCMPTGAGKSLAYVAAAVKLGYRTAILTSTKALQDQIVKDFGSIGLMDVRGRTNYVCNLDHSLTAAEAPCVYDRAFECPYSAECEYRIAIARARQANLLVTNYHFWALAKESLGKFDLVVLDEAHDSPEILASLVSLRLSQKMLKRFEWDLPRYKKVTLWRHWAAHNSAALGGMLTSFGEPSTFKKAVQMSRTLFLKRKLDRVAVMRDDDWVLQSDDRGVTFYPVGDISSYSEEMLFNGIENVVLCSATLSPKTMELLVDGLPYYIYNCDSDFAASRNPIYHVDTAKITTKSTEGDYKVWLQRIDQIISQRLDRKGLISAHSYKRRNTIVGGSKHKDILFSHYRENLSEVVATFKETHAPAVMVSPALTTGYDFPDDECRYQIIGKVPFPDISDWIMQRRMKKDKDLLTYLTTQALVQTCGRGMRSADDWCEVIIIDDVFKWFVERMGRYAPKWFMDRVQLRNTLPTPLSVEGR